MFFRLFSLVSLVFFLAPEPAAAAFGDCMDPEYLGGFGSPSAGGDELGSIRTITCVVEFEFEVSTPDGVRRIRGIRDINADWAYMPGALGGLEDGARRAAEVLPRLGEYRLDDVTILILDDTHDPLTAEPDPRGTVAAITSGNRDGGECRITSYLLGVGGSLDTVATSIAHEIFHCVQLATLNRRQNETATEGGAWWAEGSAEYLAALAIPDGTTPPSRAGAFDAAVAAQTPLYDQTYSMAVLFFWLHGEVGPEGLIPFLHLMAADSADRAQRAAMRNALTDADWLRFVESYVDRSITLPDGSALPFGEEDGETYDFAESRTERLTLDPFVVNRGWTVYRCGRWRNELRPTDANLAARKETADGWESYPQTVDEQEGDALRYRFAALHTGDTPQHLTLTGERVTSCQPCADSTELDRCIVGTWEMTGGGPISWMRDKGIDIPSADPGKRVVHFGDDGTYYTNPFNVEIEVRLDEDIAHGGSALPAAGRWSIADGRLAVCQDSGGMSGIVTMNGQRMPVSQMGGGVLVSDYSCDRSSLSTSTRIGGGSPMSTHYGRLSPPPHE